MFNFVDLWSNRCCTCSVVEFYRMFCFRGIDGWYDFEISNRILNEILKFNGNTLFTQITHDFTLYSFVESVVCSQSAVCFMMLFSVHSRELYDQSYDGIKLRLTEEKTHVA
jgi:hypothetical protein